MISHDQARARMRAHFGLRIAPEEERELRLHLTDCVDCSRLYDRHLLVAALDPRAPRAEQRLAAGLGLTRRAKPFVFSMRLGVAVAALAALLLFVGGRSEELTARGGHGAAAMAEVFVYRVSKGQHAQAVDKHIRASDELAFAYVNAAGFSRLMIFGEDERGRVYWYHPAWSDAADNPKAITIQAGPELRELPESIRHDVAGKSLHIHALFSHTELSVREVERMLEQQRTLPRARARSLAEQIGNAREVEVPLTVE